MNFQVILSKINDILKYPQRRGKKRLYQQWVERAGLPPEAIPEEEVAKDRIPKIDKNKLRLNALYILFGASITLFLVGLILVIINSC